MIWRQELKYVISGADRVQILHRLQNAMTPDPFALADGTYRVRTLYFDDLFDSAMYDSLSGASERAKYRLRMYNFDPGFLRLEEKRKRFNGGVKPSALLSREEAERLIAGDAGFLAGQNEPFLQTVYAEAKSGGMTPRLITDYTRVSFCAEGGDVRVTVDSDVRASRRTDAFFDRSDAGVPILASGLCVLEIKYNEYLPAYVPALIGLKDRPRTAMSKFAAGGGVLY